MTDWIYINRKSFSKYMLLTIIGIMTLSACQKIGEFLGLREVQLAEEIVEDVVEDIYEYEVGPLPSPKAK